MKRLISNKLCIAIIGLSVAIITITVVAESYSVNNGEEYVLTVAGGQLHFTAQPQAGYVLKTREDICSMDSINRFLKSAEDVKISPIRGLGRKGIYVIYNERPADENVRTIKTLKVQNEFQYTAPLFSSNGETVAVIPEIVVRVQAGMEIDELRTLCETAGCTISKRMEFTEQEYLLEVLGLDAEAVFAVAEQLSQAPEVEWACPNAAFRPKFGDQVAQARAFAGQGIRIASAAGDPDAPGVFPNDEYFPNQWHLYNTGQSGGTPGADIRAPEAWEITTGDPNIVVAVIDNGVDSNHPDLADNLVPGYDFYDDDNTPDPVNTGDPNDFHGTACAGLIAAEGNNGIGVSGVAWNCKIMPVRIYTHRGSQPSELITDAELATAIRWAAAGGASILSNSWYRTDVPVTHSAIVDITRIGGIGRDGRGCIVAFCAGNDGGAVVYPATKYSEVIAVGATEHNDLRSWYSNYGPALDIVAPGGGGAHTYDFNLFFALSRDLLWTTDIVGEAGHSRYNQDPSILDYTEKMSGTSAACPIVAGVAALILSIEPNLTGDEVRHFLERSAKDLGDPGRDDYYGWGRVDARAALDMVLAKRADLNDDWRVDIEDLLLLIEFWRTSETSADIAPAAKRDGIVDELDLELMMRYWQTEIPEMSTTTQ